MKNYEIYYEKHIHKSDGTYDKKIGEGFWSVAPFQTLKVVSIHDLNTVLEYTPKQIIDYMNRKGAEYNKMSTEGFEDEYGLYNFELITKVKMV